MPLPDPSLEPAIRDPKKLRNTAWILVAIMILGGSLILFSYEQWSKKQAKDDRPAVIYRITPERDLRMLRQDGRTVDLVNLRGKVIVLNVFSRRDPEASVRSLEVMKRLAATYANHDQFALVSLIIDPIPSDQLLESLQETATAQGMNLPLWWLGSNEPKTLHKFIKNELKATIYPHENEGKWEYDSSVVLIDKNGHLRRAVVPQKQGGPPFVATFDFEQALVWDAKKVLTGTDRSNAEELEHLLTQTLDRLLTEPYKP
jgi:cytochrome oxidase Cu insertion factor (SCO1/SenC/PrrC family)